MSKNSVSGKEDQKLLFNLEAKTREMRRETTYTLYSIYFICFSLFTSLQVYLETLVNYCVHIYCRTLYPHCQT
jgi:hypothetical protein